MPNLGKDAAGHFQLSSDSSLTMSMINRGKDFPRKTPTLLLVVSDLSSQIVTNFFWEFRCAVLSVFKGFLMNSSSRWVYREALVIDSEANPERLASHPVPKAAGG